MNIKKTDYYQCISIFQILILEDLKISILFNQWRN